MDRGIKIYLARITAPFEQSLSKRVLPVEHYQQADEVDFVVASAQIKSVIQSTLAKQSKLKMYRVGNSREESCDGSR